MSISRAQPLLVGLLLLSACSEKPDSTFTYGTQGKPSSTAAAPATPAPAAAPAAPQPAEGVPPSGDPKLGKDPAFYLPPDADLKTTASGLKYLMLRDGSGTSPTTSSHFNAHYCGWLTDGTRFDSSYARNEPLSYPVNRMIAGWQEALTTLMKPGSEYILVVPSELGYGAAGMPPVIPPNATLVFRMELLSTSG